MPTTRVSRSCYIGGLHANCPGSTTVGDEEVPCGCQCHQPDNRIELLLTPREILKLETMVKKKARYQDSRPSPLHKSEADFLYELADKLERARLRV